MSIRSEWSCWEIMKCDVSNKCPARQQPDKMCWEITQEMDARSFDICQDCLVYVSRQEDNGFTREDILRIMTQKGINVMERRNGCRCPQRQLNNKIVSLSAKGNSLADSTSKCNSQ
ncbi:MAG: hypothetical protein KKB91_03535 [Proteobacteria bacterium]|nr:hypothetical protein [Desulfocapsa sp.]MBU3945613.1 hypothetical protein [Pseudomonadota bacterium]MCG2745858.1 hypothetical protein [Desulfobacteraceae bacterium]MDO8947072.1 hypothetical protein [Desulfocapsaceae bacterium]MBU3984171.1 hypothetical protein [Pseudomonadota bacterium]